MPTSKDYQKAITSVLARLSDSYRRMLEANYRAVDHTLTPSGLAQAAGYRNVSAVNLHYGKLGTLIGDELQYVPKTLSLQGRTCMTFVFASWNAPKSAWVLMPEVVEALDNLGWTDSRS